MDEIVNPQPGGETGNTASQVKRGEPDVPEDRKRLVSQWQENIRADAKHFEKVFKRMRDDMQYARRGADEAWIAADHYTVPLINRHINQSVATLYAKNPKASVKKRKRLYYQHWDGKQETAQAALMTHMQTGGMDVSAAQILAEIQHAKEHTTMLTRLSQTMEILFDYFTDQGTPTFKVQMKQAVRRSKTCSVAFVEVDFQRVLEPDPAVSSRIDDMTNLIAEIESSLADLQDGEAQDHEAQIAQLKLNLEQLQQEEMILAHEGVTFDFPKSYEIIPHKAMTQLKGFVGCDYITREFHMTPKEIQRIFKVDIGDCFRGYTDPYSGGNDLHNEKKANVDTAGVSNKKKPTLAKVWRVQDKLNRQVFTLVEGYPDFIVEPKSHPLKVDGFWTIFALTFNDVEDEHETYPISDTHYLKHPQREYNNARQGLREHRQANRPKYFVRKGALEDNEKALLETYPPHAVIEVKNMDEKTPIESIIQGFRGLAIDPNLYETNSIIQDLLYSVGSQDANLGPTSGATATESSISEQSRMSSLASNVDDLDSFLSSIARAVGQIMLAEMAPETVKEIAGQGAVWPELNREEISKEIYLDIKAGSSGKPNKAAELANMERGMPFLIQLPGVNGETLAKRYADLLDIDVEELILEGMPSITALNAMAARSVGPAQNGSKGKQVQAGAADGSDPNQQGLQGELNTPGLQENERRPGAQPLYPAEQVNPTIGP